jgi:hypothetical protein
VVELRELESSSLLLLRYTILGAESIIHPSPVPALRASIQFKKFPSPLKIKTKNRLFPFPEQPAVKKCPPRLPLDTL